MAIRIHPANSTRISDETAATKLQRLAPKGSRKTQDVLIAAKKLLTGSSILSSEKSKKKILQNECYQLKDCLRDDGYKSDKLDGFMNAEQGDVVIEFLSFYSDAYPNWQDEYALLNRMIPLYFT